MYVRRITEWSLGGQFDIPMWAERAVRLSPAGLGSGKTSRVSHGWIRSSIPADLDPLGPAPPAS